MAIKIDADDEEIQRIVPVLTSLQEACHDLGSLGRLHEISTYNT